MVDPNPTRAGKDESVSTPDVRGVEVCNFDVLDDDVGYANEAQTLSDEFGGCAESNKGLVRRYIDPLYTSRVERDAGERKAVAARVLSRP